MKKIIVIGSPGAGKTTFCRALQKQLSLPLYHLDLLWHMPDRTTVTKEEFDRRLAELLATDEWIIDGNYKRTLPSRLEACDTVFFLDYETDVCLRSIQDRIGQDRPDLPWRETSLDPEFAQYVRDFRTEQTPLIYSLLEPYRGKKQITVFRNRTQADAFLEQLRQQEVC